MIQQLDAGLRASISADERKRVVHLDKVSP
jgi:hypothetical protein